MLKIFVCDDLYENYSSRGIKVYDFTELSNVNKDDDVVIVDSEMLAMGSVVPSLLPLTKNILLVHNYTLVDFNQDVLLNISTVESDDIESLTQFDISDLFKNRSNIVVEDKFSKVINLTLQEQVSLLNEFLNAIDTMSPDEIEQAFNNKFDKFKNISEPVLKCIEDLRVANKDIQMNGVEINRLNCLYTNLQSKYKNLVESGAALEEVTKKYATRIEELQAELDDANNYKEHCRETIEESKEYIRKYAAENKELKDTLDVVRSSEQQYKQSLQQLQVENNTLVESLNNISMNSKDVNVKVVDMGKVSKVIYVKYIDFVPYIINTFRMYQKRCLGKLKSKVGLCLVCDENSTTYLQYSSKCPTVTRGQDLVDCEKTMYLIKGFDSVVTEYISKCNCDLVFVVDSTLQTDVFIDCAFMESLFVVNSKESIDLFSLSPFKCITQNHLIENAIHVKYFEDYGHTLLGPIIEELNLTVFSRLDKLWR